MAAYPTPSLRIERDIYVCEQVSELRSGSPVEVRPVAAGVVHSMPRIRSDVLEPLRGWS